MSGSEDAAGAAEDAAGAAEGAAAAAGAPLDALLAQVRFGADGLVTAVAIDDDGGQVLMLAHMNRESLGLTLANGYMTYWSRSRRKLWLKGETSGNRQQVVSASLDCDGDALVFRVRPEGNGAACHEGYRTCFFRLRQGGEWVVQGKPIPGAVG